MIIENSTFKDGEGLYLDNPVFLLNQPSRNTDTITNIVRDCTFKNMEGDVEDGITCINPQVTIISNCLFTREGKDPTTADELASVVQGADVLFYRCYFKCNGKGVLVGSGDTDLTDLLTGQRVIFYECIFENVCRRNPFAQIGQVYLIRSIVKNWGTKEYFHAKSYGARAGYMGQLIVKDTVFKQESLWNCLKRGTLLKDIFGHYLYHLFLVPGFARAAYADCHGQIACYNCYKNRWWLYIENHRTKYMSKDSAELFESYLYETVAEPLLKLQEE